MEPIQVVVLAVLQGVVEFLPISSSGHLILVPAFFGWPDQGLAFDIAVHLGTLAAVVTYFRRDIASLVVAAFDRAHPEFALAWSLVLATIPVGLAGVTMADLVDTVLRTPAVVAATTGGFGILLWVADRFGRGTRSERGLGLKRALLIGLGQALAIVPGTSRSGITMTVGLAVGLTREAAARFSFLLAIPAISMAAGWNALELATTSEPVVWAPMLVAAGISAVTAFAAIAAFLRLIERVGMWAFALYRVILALVIVAVLV